MGVPTTIAVFGGSGFIGSHLLSRLSGQPNTKIISIDIQDPRQKIAGIVYHKADVRDLSNYEIENSVDHIYHLAAVHTTPGHESWEYYATNVGGSLQILDFARRHHTKYIHFTSTMSVYGPSEDLKYETSPPKPVSDYGRSKILAETIMDTWLNEDHSRRLVISRPAVVFGYGENGNFTRLSKILSKGFFVFPGRKDTIKSCIYVKDLITWILHAEALNKRRIVFNGAFSNRYTILDIVNAFEAVAYPKIWKFVAPISLLKMASKILTPISKASGLGIHPERIDKLTRSTNIYPQWAIDQKLDTNNLLERSLRDWLQRSKGARFE